jgi:hypothetical protein
MSRSTERCKTYNNTKQGEQQQELREVPALDTSLNALAKVGGFDFLEAVGDGADSMNPARSSQTNIFLTDASKKVNGRQSLGRNLKVMDGSNGERADQCQKWWIKQWRKQTPRNGC